MNLTSYIYNFLKKNPLYKYPSFGDEPKIKDEIKVQRLDDFMNNCFLNFLIF